MPINYSFTPSKIARFYAPDERTRFTNSIFPSQQVAENTRPAPEMSKKAQKRIRRAVNWLTYLSARRSVKGPKGKKIPNFQIAFVTLTLPTKQMHGHKEITSRCLNRFLVDARKKWGVQNYVWKAELQANGNIHYHITWDKYVHYMAIRRVWNNAIAKLGYIEAYQNIMIGLSFSDYNYYRKEAGATDEKANKKAYESGQADNWLSPNTTDVKNVRSVKNLASYLSKYLSKPAGDEDKTGPIADSLQELTGRLWYCSQSLSRMKSAVSDWESIVSQLYAFLKKKARLVVTPNMFCEVAFIDIKRYGHNARDYLREIFVSYAIDQNYPFPAGFPAI